MEELIDLQVVQEVKKKDEIEFPENGTSLDLLRAIYRSVTLPLSTRMRAAGMALQFEHPKLSVTAQVNSEDFAAAMERATRRSAKAIEQSKAIEHRPLARRV